MDPIIDARALTKRFRRTTALDGLDLVAPAGSVTAVLGPNGSGKTTFVRAVATLLRPDGGTLAVGGIDVTRRPAAVRRLIGLAGQHAALEGAMTGRENLRMVARLFGHRRRRARTVADAVLDHLDLGDAADRLVRTYSGGMRRRLDLGASLVGSPRLLLLDEPTTGIDPRSRLELWDLIRQLVRSGTDVLLTTQYLDEADHLADHIVVIDHGRRVAAGTPAELKARVGRDVIEIEARTPGVAAVVAEALGRIGDGAPRLDDTGRTVSVSVGDGTSGLRHAVRILDELAVDVDGVRLRQPTLDEVFLTLTGRPVGETPAAA